MKRTFNNNFHLKNLKTKRWADIKISYKDGRLLFSGSYGSIISQSKARKFAKENWVSYFEEDWNTIKEMNERCGTNFKSPKTAAKYVLDTDGEFHGIDGEVRDDNKFYRWEGCGQCLDTIVKDFPEIEPLISIWEKWHLNDMRPQCEHQDALCYKLKAEGVNLTYNIALTYPDLAKCPVCGYKYGDAWTKRKVPSEVLEIVKNFKV